MEGMIGGEEHSGRSCDIGTEYQLIIKQYYA